MLLLYDVFAPHIKYYIYIYTHIYKLCLARCGKNAAFFFVLKYYFIFYYYSYVFSLIYLFILYFF